MKDIKFWLLATTAFVMLFINGPVTTFLPIIINQLGFTGFTSLLLIMPAGAIIGTVQLMAPYCAMKLKNARVWIIVVTCLMSLLGSILLWQLPLTQVGARLFAVYILAFYRGGYAVLMGLTVANCAGYTKRSLSSSGIFIGYCLGECLNVAYWQCCLLTSIYSSRQLRRTPTLLRVRSPEVQHRLDCSCGNNVYRDCAHCPLPFCVCLGQCETRPFWHHGRVRQCIHG